MDAGSATSRWPLSRGFLATAADYAQLARIRIVAMSLLTMAASAWLCAALPPAWPAMLPALLGTALVIAGALALNQRLEVEGDRHMRRTAHRPLAAGRLTTRRGTLFGGVSTGAGLAILLWLSPVEVAFLAALAWVLYVGIYTPLKRHSPWQTFVGAVPGAMPPLIGAAAVGAAGSPLALGLFAILFLWQFPHTMAIAWLYRADSAAAGVRVATVVDPSGRWAGWIAVAAAVVLIPAGLVPTLADAAGWWAGAAATAAAAGYLAASWRFLARRDNPSARRLLRASLLYLPLVYGALLLAAALRTPVG